MDELKAALEDDGFRKVATVVASGNVLFEHDREPDEALAERIARVIRDRFEINSFAAVRSKAELRSALEDNPFAKDGEHKYVHTIFLAEPLDGATFEAFAKSYVGPERLAAGTREYYVDYAEGVARSKLDPAVTKAKVIKCRATARNLRSLQRILDKMDG